MTFNGSHRTVGASPVERRGGGGASAHAAPSNKLPREACAVASTLNFDMDMDKDKHKNEEDEAHNNCSLPLLTRAGLSSPPLW